MRIKEFFLLILIFGASFSGFYAAGAPRFAYLSLLVNLPFFFLWLLNNFFLRKSNEFIIPVVSLLSNLGCINLYQISPKIFNQQLKNIYFALAAALISVILLKRLQKPFSYRFIYGTAGLFLFILPLVFGKEIYGAKLWINIGGLSFQPAEIGRIFFILFISGYLGEHHLMLTKSSGLGFKKKLIYLFPAIVMTIFSLLLLIFVKDLGFSLLILSIFLSALFIASEDFFYVAFSLAMFAAGASGAYYLFPHVKTRIDIWLNPWNDVYGKSYQITQALFAYAEGGVIGTGLGHSFPSVLPAAPTDMALAIFAESCGLSGALIVVSAIFLLSFLLVRASQQSKSVQEKIFLSTAAFSLAFQTFLVTAGTLNLLPLTGLTIPFFSYGGSSYIASTVLVFLALYFSQERKRWIVQ